ncbi:MAG: response regulator receiver protein [Spirosoma sp.]|nr:response regulator receiver protein [Spirosoma sp.]
MGTPSFYGLTLFLPKPMTHLTLVFVVDDSADFRLLVQAVFKRFLPAYELRLFASGEALRHHALRTPERPGLILLDYHMQGLTGHHILQLLKRHPDWQTIPVAMLSSDASEGEMEACYRTGANSFLKKPIGLVALQGLLESVCHYWLDVNQPLALG